jgi:hypothetical protein
VQVTQREPAAGVAPIVAAVRRAVVGHDPLDRHALAREPGDRTLQERHRAALALVGEDLAVGQARGIVDADVHGLPAGAPPSVAPIAGHAVTNRFDAPELLGVDVDQLARPLALVAHDRWPRLERRQPAEPEPAQDAADRRDRNGELARDRRAAQALASPAFDLGHAHVCHLVPRVLGRRAPVGQRCRPAAAVAREPTVSLALRQSRGAGGRDDRPALLDHPPHQQESTLRRQTRILVHVHPGDPPIRPATIASRSLTRLPRMNNLHSNHS